MPKKKPNGLDPQSTYDPDIIAEIFDKLATTPTGLKNIVESDSRYPSLRTVYNWIDKVKGLHAEYVRVREAQARTLVDLAVVESQNRKEDRILNKEERTTKQGSVVRSDQTRPDTANVLRSRLIVDTYFKAAALFNPREFAVKNKLEIGADVELTPTISVKMGGSGEQAKHVEPPLPDVEVLE